MLLTRYPTSHLGCALLGNICIKVLRHIAGRQYTQTHVRHGEHDYAAAVAALNTLQSNASILDAIRKSRTSMNHKAMHEMREWCKRIGYESLDFDRLNIIHVAGTKGKGSTSAFISSILNQYRKSNAPEPPSSSPTSSKPLRSALRKIGLYTSPHLRSVRERIQINNEPLSEEQFARYFFYIWDRLEASAARLGLSSSGVDNAVSTNSSVTASAPPDPTKPVYFRYLTLMAFHIYLSEGIDTAIIECGIGGAYDSTNVIQSPNVAAITSLGIDHTPVLGETIEEIAWHKAGIFKPSAKTRQVFTVHDQPPAAMKVLQQRAVAAGLELCIVARHPDIESGVVQLGLAADFQKTNASLAVAVAAAQLRSLGFEDIPEPLSKDPLPAEFVRGLQTTHWGGRCEIRRERNIVWYIDGGHTLESIRLAAQWFGSQILSRLDPRTEQKTAQNRSKKTQRCVLLFNQQTRDAPALARVLHQSLAEVMAPVTNYMVEGEITATKMEQRPLFTSAVFSTNITYSIPPDTISQSADAVEKGRYKPDLMSMYSPSADVSKLTVQKELAEVWQKLDPATDATVAGTIEDAIADIRGKARKTDGETMVFVTGSLHLVGGVLEVLESGSTSDDSI